MIGFTILEADRNVWFTTDNTGDNSEQLCFSLHVSFPNLWAYTDIFVKNIKYFDQQFPKKITFNPFIYLEILSSIILNTLHYFK